MRQPAGRASITGLIVILAVGMLAWNVSGTWNAANVTVPIDNRSATSPILRITDSTSGRALGTVRVDPGVRTVVGPVRLDVWWRDLSVLEQAEGWRTGCAWSC